MQVFFTPNARVFRRLVKRPVLFPGLRQYMLQR